jgi:outer membrane protein assembly factor BamA
LLAARSASALHYLEAEESISDLLRQESSPKAEGEEEENVAERRWAILPQLGFGPETGFEFGAKFTDRDFLSSGATFDVDALYAIEDQQYLSVELARPEFLGKKWTLMMRALFRNNPRRRFFGLGNNDQEDLASRHEIQQFGGEITSGWEVVPHLSLNLQIAGWRYDIRNGKSVDDAPPTPERFPDLPGIEGGVLIPFSASLVYDDRVGGLTRPTQGWRVFAKVMTANSDLGSDFDFTRFLGDVSYLYPFFDDRLILGARAGGQYIDGAFSKIPFWGLADLGGEDTLRGYFPYRFLGTSDVYATLEARVGLFGFDLFDWWRIQVDAAGFGEVGRVFLDSDDLTSEEPLTPELETNNDVRVSYGGGLRLAFSEAMVVRVDLGFSNEETALVYLTFGHVF